MGEIHTSAMSTSLCSAVTYSTGLGECRQSERERERIYPVSFPVLPSDVFLTLFMICLHASQYPPLWRFYTCFCLSVCLSLSMMLFLLVCLSFPLCSTCFPPSSSPTIYPRLAAGSRVGTHFSPFSPGDTPDAASPSTPILTTRSRGSVFCCSWTALSKSLSFALSVCAARLTKTQTPFFQPEVLVLALQPALCPHLHTHHTPTPLTETPNISFSKQGREGER